MQTTKSLPPISIIIITLNEEIRLPRLLDQLRRQTYQDVEIIVSDSNSQDHTKEKAEIYRPHRTNFLFHQCGVTKGPGYGRNRGAEQASHDLLLFLDADIQLPDDEFLEHTVAHFIDHQFDVAGCYLQAKTSHPVHIGGIFITNTLFFIMHRTKKPLLAGCYVLAKKSVHKHIGGFDEGAYLGEDSAYATQAITQGYKFRLMPYRFIFDMRRITEKGIRHTLRTYLTGFSLLLRQKKMLYTDAKKKVEYEYDIYKKQ